jgi:hypothetical protein
MLLFRQTFIVTKLMLLDSLLQEKLFICYKLVSFSESLIKMAPSGRKDNVCVVEEKEELFGNVQASSAVPAAFVSAKDAARLYGLSLQVC